MFYTSNLTFNSQYTGGAKSMGVEFLFGGDIFDPFKSEERQYESLTELATVEDLIEKESHSKYSIYRSPTLVFSDFLQKRFGLDLTAFMKMYTKEHLTAWGINVPEGIVLLPVGPTTIFFFAESSDPKMLAKKLANYQASVVPTTLGGTRLNLHNNTIYKFTLIRANFSLADAKDDFFFGYYFKKDKFRFLIKSSVKADLTVVYEDI